MQSTQSSSCTSCSRPSGQTPSGQNGQCAPLMSDGRLFTNWQPRCAQAAAMVGGSFEGRQKLITEASEIMKKNAADAYLAARCGPCYENPDWNTGTMLPEHTVQVCNQNGCTFVVNNPNGLGVGRQYWSPKVESSYLKQFLSLKEKEQDFFKGHMQGVSSFTSDYMPVTRDA